MGGMARLSDIGNMARNLPKPEDGQNWYRIVNKADDKAEVYIYDEIGFWGITAAEFVRDLQAVKANTIDLRLNTPGGEVFDGIAIYNALRRHPAKVTTYVDGIAASAGSFIAMAGDEVVMSKKAQMMIHDARGLAIGNATDMQEMADLLNRQSDIIASIYSDRAGGTVEEWRAVMKGEQWYTDQEAVDAGLADRILEDTVVEESAIKDRFANAIFNKAGQEATPPPNVLSVEKPHHNPVRPVTNRVTTPPVKPSVKNKEKEAGPVDPVKLRESLGLGADASDEEVRAALAAEGVVENRTPAPSPVRYGAVPEGARFVDEAVLASLQTAADEGKEAAAWVKQQRMDQILDQAIADGKFPPARREHWEKLYKLDPDGIKDHIDNMAPGLLPTTTKGYAGSVEEHNANTLYDQMYPKAGV